MSLLRYLRHRCACCGSKIPKGTEYIAIFALFMLCDACMTAGCCRHISPGPAYWIHLGAKA